MGQSPLLVVVGGSAGSIEALRNFLPQLPAELPAAVMVVVHRAPVADDERLPHVLGRGTLLPAEHARHEAPILPGRIYVAPANVHLQVVAGRMLLSSGPKINGARPAIDSLFFSAARHYGSRAVGVILSGLLDDGVAGLAQIKVNGGRALVQDPNDAVYADMPRGALRNAEVDVVASASELAEYVVRFCTVEAHPHNGAHHEPAGEESSRFTCPECGGVLTEYRAGGVDRFRCRTGHEYSIGSYVERQDSALENALFIALRTLDERAEFCGRLAKRMRAQGLQLSGARMDAEAREARERATVIRGVLHGEAGLLEEAHVQETVDTDGLAT